MSYCQECADREERIRMLEARLSATAEEPWAYSCSWGGARIGGPCLTLAECEHEVAGFIAEGYKPIEVVPLYAGAGGKPAETEAQRYARRAVQAERDLDSWPDAAKTPPQPAASSEVPRGKPIPLLPDPEAERLSLLEDIADAAVAVVDGMVMDEPLPGGNAAAAYVTPTAVSRLKSLLAQLDAWRTSDTKTTAQESHEEKADQP